MSSLATRHYQKFSLLSGENDGFKKNRKPGIFKKVLNSGGERWILKISKTWNFLKTF
jgi:hypothetical protein